MIIKPTDAQIKIFDNKISFFNLGGLYGNITEEELHTDDYRGTRNKQIAEAFILQTIRKYGSGFIFVFVKIAEYPWHSLCLVPQGFFELEYKVQK